MSALNDGEPDAPGAQQPERSAVGRLLGQGAIYTLANILLKGSGVLLLPLYLNTAYLSKQALGQLAILETTALLVVQLMTLGLPGGLVKFMSDASVREEHASMPFTALVTAIAAAAVSLALFWLAAPALGSAVLSGPGDAPLIRVFGLYVSFRILGAVPFAFLQVRERAALYAIGMLTEALIFLGGVYYGLYWLRAGLEAVLWSYVGSAGVGALVLVGGTLRTVLWKPSRAAAARLLRFGVPLAAAGLALPFLNAGDRYLLAWFTTKEDVAVYTVAARLAGVVNLLLVQSFQVAFSVIGYKALAGGGRDGSLHRRMFRHYAVVGGWLVLAVSILSYDVTRLLSASGDTYLQAAPLVMPLAMGFLFYGLYVLVVNIVYAQGDTRVVARNVMSAAALNAGLNLIAIPLLKGAGAALTTLIPYAALAYFTARTSERLAGITFSWRTLLLATGFVTALWGIAMWSLSWRAHVRLVCLAALVLSYPVGVLAFGLYTRAEVETAVRWVRTRMRREPG